MFFSSIIINEYDSIVKRENEYFSIFVSVAQFYCELSMTQALFFVQADQICGRLAAVLTAARTGCAWAPSLLLRVVSSACPAAVRPSRSARPAARPAVLPCPGPAVPLLLRSARPALLRQSGGQPSALPAASKKLRHPAPRPGPCRRISSGRLPSSGLAGGADTEGGSAHGGRDTMNRQTSQLRQTGPAPAGCPDQGAVLQSWPGGRSREGGRNGSGKADKMWLQPHFLTTSETFPDRAAAAQRKSRCRWSRLRLRSWAALPLLPLPCRHGAGGCWYAQQRLNKPKNRPGRTGGGGVASWRTFPAAGPAPAP